MPAITDAPHNAESIEAIAKRLKSQVLRLQAAVEILKAYRIESVRITHQSELTGGLKKIENWGDAVHRCIHQHLDEMGAYKAPDSAVSTPKKKGR